MTQGVTGKHVVITGGGSGVGATMAQQFAEAGAHVTVMGRRAEPLASVAKGHGAIATATCDVTDPGSVSQAFDVARAAHGPVQIVIANAGAANSVPFHKMTPELLSSMLAVNLGGVVNVWQAGLADMKPAGWGRLIAVASTAGLKGYGYVSAYCAAKHGVVGLTRSLAIELGQTGVTTNAICPGFIDTPMLDRSVDNIVAKTGMDADKARATLYAQNPQKRFIQTDEVAQTALWLCSDGARSVNGHALSLSGGEI